jgi:hypothetical protein
MWLKYEGGDFSPVPDETIWFELRLSESRPPGCAAA